MSFAELTFDFVRFLHRQPTEVVLALEFLLAYGGAMLLMRLFGKAGLYMFVPLAVVLANIQVLRATSFSFYPDPVALGTVTFTATYFATDLLAELYGRKAARKAVWLGFAGMLLSTALMLVAIGYHPLTLDEAGEGMAWAVPNQDHMAALFLPAPALLIASLAAFLIAQYHDIWIYGWIRRLTRDRLVWARAALSTSLSTLIDNTIFSVLAWVILTDTPIDATSLIWTFILGTYAMRVVLAVLEVPFIYLARRMQPRAAARIYREEETALP